MPRKPTIELDLKKVKSDDVPASVGLVKAVRRELRAEIRGSEHRLTSKIVSVEGQLTSKMEDMASQIQETLTAVHRTQALMEEQRGENRIVLDGIQNLAQRQDRIEGEVVELRKSMQVFVARTI